MDTLLEKAMDAYYKYCKNNNIRFQQPCQYSSEVKRKYVYLRNVTGDLGKYEIKTGKITL